MKINKFGGSILQNSQDVKIIAELILQNDNTNSINVVSAFYDITNALIKLANLSKNGRIEYEMQLEFVEHLHLQICLDLKIETIFVEDIFVKIKKSLDAVFQIKDLSSKTLDAILVYGEILSSKIIYKYLKKNNNNIEYVDATQLIKTDSNFGNASIDILKTAELAKNIFVDKKIYIVTGFISSDLQNNPTTLGCNGSDLTASLIASLLHAKQITIWRDVDGIFTAKKDIVLNAIQIDTISYKEMAELSYFGSKTISLQALQSAILKNIPIIIRSIYNQNNEGTKICDDTNKNLPIKGISKIDNIVLLSVNGFNMIGVRGFSARIFNCLSKDNVNVVFISQSSSEVSVCIGVKFVDLQTTKAAIENEFNNELKQGLTEIEIKQEQSIIAIAGFGMANTTGIASKLFNNIAKGNININAISQGLSEMNISFAVNTAKANLAVRLIHNSIFENKKINCLIAGNGLVGSSVIKMIQSQQDYFKNKGLDLNIIGYFNSKKYFNYLSGEEQNYSSFDEIITKFIKEADINYSLIDCTSSDLLVENYQKFIENGFNIITPNKKANTLDIDKFNSLQQCLQKHKKHFFYEANVGAGLPIISTIKDLIDCGDEIIKIEGIFSGTLSYIFNSLSVNKKFSEIVLDAKQKGFTEPNPKDDLSGSDVGRKLLILARIIGYKINLSDIDIQSLAEITDDEIDTLNQKANKNNQVLRYIGTIENGKAYTKLMSIGVENSLASTQYTDNIISITTKFYSNTPLVIKGPGAGAEVTAIGIVSDLIKLSNLL